MKKRVIIKEIQPEAYRAMNALEKYLHKSSVSAGLKELIKIRASQLNGCAYCLEIHTRDARKNGETEQRLYALSAWWESPLFSEREKAVLDFTDRLTLTRGKGIPDGIYGSLENWFNEKEMAEIIMQIITINAWNRIAVSTHLR
ncbi:carboxymuconolactone decarboxylase family protein [Zunongwangia sp. F363]|uniref:Carboxymuconolactone decarboxylase family protein n=1 Tax=Autumnicola tepida TaxID=3075595 RepID=A0ABU3CEQ0_9FLAO|nr:carboxymuconolactone decarboxylase family protein [Zunongwangia sp. F363]MDT0644820.1 carboxymuconolactone decarboxylase family protein [Zunongwangia sp. F363]